MVRYCSTSVGHVSKIVSILLSKLSDCPNCATVTTILVYGYTNPIIVQSVPVFQSYSRPNGSVKLTHREVHILPRANMIGVCHTKEYAEVPQKLWIWLINILPKKNKTLQFIRPAHGKFVSINLRLDSNPQKFGAKPYTNYASNGEKNNQQKQTTKTNKRL